MSPRPIQKTASAYQFPLQIKHLLISALARASDREIIYGDDRVRYDYPHFNQRVARLANVLEKIGTVPGDTVAVMDWDSHRYLESYFAIPCSGRVMLTVNIRLSPEQILYTLNHSGARALIVHTDFLPILEQIHERLETIESFILIDEDDYQPQAQVTFAGEYEDLVASVEPECEFPELDENTQATAFYTTGTTGNPKGVYYSHRQIVLHTLGILASFGTAPEQGRVHWDDVYMPITPMFHGHCWGWPFATVLLGMKQVFPGQYDPPKLLRLIQKEGVTFTHCVPTLLHMLLTHPDSKKTDLRGLKMLIGASPLPTGLARMAIERGIDVCTGYGMSETGPVQVINHLTTTELQSDLDAQVPLRVRAGRPVLLCDVRVVDEDMNTLPRDGESVGEIVFRSPWLTQGYFKDPEKSEALWKGGWLHSGDIGSANPDGSFHVSDRLKDVIKSGGEWISSHMLESLLSEHPAVGEAAVIAVNDEKWGERPLALVVPAAHDGAQPDEAGFIAHLNEAADRGTISKYAVPERVIFVKEIDKTSVGKIDKKALRQKYGNEDLHSNS